MTRFLKLKDIYENQDGDMGNGLILKLTWWEEERYLCYVEEYEGYGSEKTLWQVDKKLNLVRHTGYKPSDIWTKWEKAA